MTYLPMPTILRGDARRLPLADNSVDLVVTSPPYYALRSYRDGGDHYEGQIGAESTPAEYLDALMECTREMMRVLKQSGSVFVNLGDKYAGTDGTNGGTAASTLGGGRSNGRPRDFGSSTFDGSGRRAPGRPKSLLGIPWRYALRCVDELGLILRAEIVWSKPNALPESATDRVRRSHETWFHFTKQPRYYSAVDEIREPVSGYSWPNGNGRESRGGQKPRKMLDTCNPLGKLPGSVWEIATQPLIVPDHISHARCCNGQKREGCTDGLDHFAAFPPNLVRPIIKSWSPRQVCTACGEGRRPVIEVGESSWQRRRAAGHPVRYGIAEPPPSTRLFTDPEDRAAGGLGKSAERILVGYACACPDTTQRGLPGVVLDPFGGTGTTALVATMLGRHGITVDASEDYGRLAQWRCNDPKERARAAGLGPSAVSKLKSPAVNQGSLFDEGAA